MKIEVSNGEIVDKLTILLIKEQNIKDDLKLINIKKEIQEISPMSDSIVHRHSFEFRQLYEINKTLWQVEDKIRLKESKKEFDEEFISLARLVYHMNDQRAGLKKTINNLSKSYLVEEKSYEQYN